MLASTIVHWISHSDILLCLMAGLKSPNIMRGVPQINNQNIVQHNLDS